jgi:hypothetical protein
LTWFLFAAITLPSGRQAIFNPTPDTIAGFLGELLLLSRYSLYLVGWLTTLIGSVVGAVLAKKMARLGWKE